MNGKIDDDVGDCTDLTKGLRRFVASCRLVVGIGQMAPLEISLPAATVSPSADLSVHLAFAGLRFLPVFAPFHTLLSCQTSSSIFPSITLSLLVSQIARVGVF